MPMVVYTEEEMINHGNQYAAEVASKVAEERDRMMAENTQLRRSLNEIRDACRDLVNATNPLIERGADFDHVRLRAAKIVVIR